MPYIIQIRNISNQIKQLRVEIPELFCHGLTLGICSFL